MIGKSAASGFIAALLLSGCALGGLVGGGSAPVTYDLEAPELAKPVRSARSVHLAIHSPIAVRTIDTEEILVKSGDGKLAYFPGSVWGDRLPRLFQARLVEVFSNSGAFRAVVTSLDRVSGELSLTVELRAFQVEVSEGRAEAVVDVFVKLVDERSGVVIGTKRFVDRSPAVKDDVESGVRALNDAFHRISMELLNWTAHRRGQA
jgi:cholesterol transport system auxiliary component